MIGVHSTPSQTLLTPTLQPDSHLSLCVIIDRSRHEAHRHFCASRREPPDLPAQHTYLPVEEFRKPGAPAHHALLGAGVVLIEGLNLRDVEPGIYETVCLPLLVVGADGAPARFVLCQS